MPKKIDEKQVKWVEENSEVNDWLDELKLKSEKTSRNRKYHLYHYFLWLKQHKGIASAKQLLEEYKQLRKQDKEYEHNKYVKQYLFSETNAPKSYNWREGVLSTVREFYRYNHLPLPSEKIDLRNTQIDAMHLLEASVLRPMTLNDFKKLIAPAKIREKSMLLTMLQSGMGVGELTKQFNVCACTTEILKKHGHICAAANVLRQLRQNKHPIKIEPLIAFKQRNTHDNRAVYFTFIGKDAIDLLKQYLAFRRELVLNAIKQLKAFEQRQKKGHYLHAWEKLRMNLLKERLKHVTPEMQEGESIYITNLLNPVGEHSVQHSVRILKKQTGLLNRQFTPHTCRDLFKTTADHVGVKDTISEYWIRHKLDKYGYNQLDKLHPEDSEKEYAKLETELNILSKETIVPHDVLRELNEERSKRTDLEQKLQKLEKFVAEVVPRQAPELDYYDEVIDAIRSNSPDAKIKTPIYDVIWGEPIVIQISGYLDDKGKFHERKSKITKPQAH